MALADELSGDIAVAILATKVTTDRDRDELLDIVLAVHGTLRELSVEEQRKKRVSRFSAKAFKQQTQDKRNC
jgi:hypothetical protein